MDTSKLQVINNEAKNRFQVKVDKYLAVCEYKRVKDRIIFTHTEVPTALEGQGVGSLLAKTALDYAISNELKIMPLCPYIAAYIKRHQEYLPHVLEGFRIK